MNDATVRMELLVREFFATPPRKIKVEDVPATGRVYFIAGDRIVGVGKPEERRP